MIGWDDWTKKRVHYLSCIEGEGDLIDIWCITKMPPYLFIYYKISFGKTNIKLEIFPHAEVYLYFAPVSLWNSNERGHFWKKVLSFKNDNRYRLIFNLILCTILLSFNQILTYMYLINLNTLSYYNNNAKYEKKLYIYPNFSLIITQWIFSLFQLGIWNV